MNIIVKELAYCETPLGALSLRYRTDPACGEAIYEIKLNDEYLMSSLFTVAEEALARLGLAALDGTDLDVAVGGLGLGYTAWAALEDPRVRSLCVIEKLGEVIRWHQAQLLPLDAGLIGDGRCRLVEGDFFDLVQGAGFDPDRPQRRFHAVLLDIDHSPRHTLHAAHAWLYRPAGLRQLVQHLLPGGIFALWSNDPPDDGFRADLAAVFTDVQAQLVPFHSPVQNRDVANTVYVARASGG